MTRHHLDTENIGSEQQGLLDVLRAEYAAVFAYGLISAYSRPDRATTISTATAEHRARRDAIIDALGTAKVTAPVAEAAYTVPFPVTDPLSAAKLAIAVENDTAVAWRSALERAEAEATKRSCVEALTDCALQMARWRIIASVNPVTTAFPGKA